MKYDKPARWELGESIEGPRIHLGGEKKKKNIVGYEKSGNNNEYVLIY